MSKSKQEIWQIFKQTLLGSENPTKMQVCVFMFLHAMMAAMIFVGVFLHFDLLWSLGAIWPIFLAQALVIGLTDNSDSYIWQIVNQFFRRAIKPTKEEKRFSKRFQITAGILVGIFVLLVFAFLISGVNNIFGLLMYGVLGGYIALVVALLIWRVRDIARQIKARRQHEEKA